MMKSICMLIVNMFLAISVFANYEVEFEADKVTIKKNNNIIKTVFKDERNKEHIETIVSLIEDIKKRGADTLDTLLALPEQGFENLEHLEEEIMAQAEEYIKNIEKHIEETILKI